MQQANHTATLGNEHSKGATISMRKTNLLAAALVALAGLSSSAVLTGCAEKVGDIDRTQPNLLDRAIFDGTWYIKQTVTDVPPTSRSGAFIGAGGEMEMIRWEFTQDFLVAYRSYELVPGSNTNADAEGSDVGETPVKEGHEEGRNQGFKENPIMAYPVEYVDVVRQYNPRTGEQTNVIAENNFDREWHERKYVRVSWNNPRVANFNMFKDANSQWSSASYWVQDDENSTDAFRMERNEDGAVNYIDFTDRIFVNPSLYACLIASPWNYSEVGDCTGDEIKVRTALLKVDKERELEYESLNWDDKRQGEFGYFRTERNTWDRDYGPTWEGRQFIGNRHDIWKKSYNVSVDAEGNLVRNDEGHVVRELIPPDQREFNPIVYTLSENYPEDLIPITEDIASEWDAAFKATAAAARGQSVAQVVSDLEAQTGGSCLFCIDYNEDNDARIGDIRRNFIYWVDNNQYAGPLGYGPSFAHPETGRIVSGTAYVYGAAVDIYAQRGADMVRLINGDITEEEYEDASYIKEQIGRFKNNFDPRYLEKLKDLEVPQFDMDTPMEERQAMQHDLDVDLMGHRSAAAIAHLDTHGLPDARHGYLESQMRKIAGTPLESSLMTDEVVKGMFPGWKPGDGLGEEMKEQLHPHNWIGPDAEFNKHAQFQQFAQKNNMWLADFQDPALVGLAREIAKKGWDEAQIKQHVREQTYKAVMLHEVGHTIGLRHNFGGSADPLNYMDEYWAVRPNTFNLLSNQLTGEDLMKINCTVIDASNQAACEAQTDARMVEYQQTSIMDYGSRFNSDYQGLGKYDWAAIAAGYGDLVEVFDQDVSGHLRTVALDNNGGTAADYLNTFAAFQSPLHGNFADLIHYVNFPSIFGNIENLAKRQYIPRSQYEADGNQLVRVPYYACYDEYRDSTARCHTWDQGADHYEITKNFIQMYQEYYIFNNFQRDRISYSPFSVLNTLLGRYFLPIQNMYQNWIYGRHQLDGIGDFMSQMGMLEGFEVIHNAMAGTLYGTYVKQGNEYVWNGYNDSSAGSADAIYVPRGDGRRQFIRYDQDSGYNWIRRPFESGVFYEQLAALQALIASRSSGISVGQDVGADGLSYSLPYNLVFAEEINNLFAGLYTENGSRFAPRFVNGKLTYQSPTLAPDDEGFASGTPLRYETTWGTRIYTAYLGMIGLSINYDLTFTRRLQVALGGSGDEVNPGAQYSEVTFSDPTSGREFKAWRPTNADPDTVYPAADLVEQASTLGIQYAGLQAKLDELQPGSDQHAEIESQIRTISFEIEDKTRDLEILRGMYYYYGRAW